MDTSFQRMGGAEKHLRGAAYIYKTYDRSNYDGPSVFYKQPAFGSSGNSALHP